MSDSTQPAETEPVKSETPQQPEQPKAPDINAKLMEELNKYRAKAVELENKFKQKEVEELTKNQKWQELAELKEKEASEALAERDKLKNAFVQKEKMSAIREAAIQSGLRKESIPDLRLIDFPEIKLETNSEGEFNVSGADKAIQRLKTLRPHWFQNAVPNINSSSPVVTGDSNSITLDKIKEIEKEYNKNPNRANGEKLTGALLQFKKQANAK